MTSPEDERNIVNAGAWLAGQNDPPRAAVPILKERFGLSALQACEAIKHAQMLRRIRTATEVTLEF